MQVSKNARIQAGKYAGMQASVPGCRQASTCLFIKAFLKL